MGEALEKDGCAMPHAFFGPTQFLLDVRHVTTTTVRALDTREQVPHSFVRIHLRYRGRQMFQMKTCGSPCAHNVCDGLTTMERSSVPDHQQLPGDLTGEHLHETNHIGFCGRMVVHLHTNPSFWRHSTHRREMITGQRDREHRRLAHRGRRGDGHRQQRQRRLIDENDGPLFLFRFFRAGQRCSFQAAIAASSRCVARVMGLCRRCVRRRRRRLAWAR